MSLLGFEQRWIQKLSSAFFFVPEEHIAHTNWVHLSRVDFAGSFVRVSQVSTPQARLAMRLALWIIALLPVFQGMRPRLFISLTAQAQSEKLNVWLNSRNFLLRELCMLLKVVASFSFFEVHRGIR